MNLKDFTCEMCKQVTRCKKLCPPIEWYVSQDQVEPGKERPLPPESIGNRKFPAMPENLTTTEIIFLMYFVDKKTQPEIAEKLLVTQQYISKVVNKYKQIVITNLRK